MKFNNAERTFDFLFQLIFKENSNYVISFLPSDFCI